MGLDLDELLKQIDNGDEESKKRLLLILKEHGIKAESNFVIKSYGIEAGIAKKFGELVESQDNKKLRDAATEALSDYIKKYSKS